MQTHKKMIVMPGRLRLPALAVALIGTSALAQEAIDATRIRKDLSTPSSEVEAGVGLLSGDHRRGGEYTGMDSRGAYGILNLNFIQRDDASGTWLKFKARNLGLDNRDLRFEHERQGDWGYFVDYSQSPRFEPLRINTGLQGIGQTTQTVNQNTGMRDVNLKLEHDIANLGFRKLIDGGFEFRANFRQDEKRGERMYGRGSTVGPIPALGWPNTTAAVAAQEFLTEPIDHTTRLWELVFSYAGAQLQLSGSYNGSSYENRSSVLNVVGGSSVCTPLGGVNVFIAGQITTALAGCAAPGGVVLAPPSVPINRALNTEALPPSNYAHQFQVSGGYDFSEQTRSSFNLSKSFAFRTDSFAIANGAPAGGATPTNPPTSLGGRLETTLAFVGLTTRLQERVDLAGSLRYEDRDDRTPIAQYVPRQTPTPNVGGFPFSTAGVTGFNKPASMRQVNGKFEASYQFDGGYRLTGGLEQERVSRNIPAEFLRVALREHTDETQARIEIKRSMAENLNGAVAYIYARRTGSDYVPVTYNTVAPIDPTQFNLVNPLLVSDRRRDKLRISGDWLPDERWSVNFLGDLSADRYSGRELGPRKGHSYFASADVNYAIDEVWKLTAWVSREASLAEQKQRTDPASLFVPAADSNMIWEASIRNLSTAWGIGVKGKPLPRLELAADLSGSTDNAEHGMGRVSGGTSATTIRALPEFFYRQISLKLSADYAIERNSGIRGLFIHEHRRNNDWTWQNYVYADGTTVTNPTLENSNFLGATYYYRWR